MNTPKKTSKNCKKKLLKIIFGTLLDFIQLLFLILSTTSSFAQISISTGTGTVTENFNGMGATTNLPANWRVHHIAAPAWAAASTTVTQQASGGAPVTGGTYNWGTTPAIDRAIGVMTSGAFSSPSSLLGYYRNTDATNLISISVAYDAERYRINTAAASVQFFYSLDGSTWTAVPAGDIAAASFPAGASAYTFGVPLTINMTGIVITFPSPIAANADFYLRWNLNTTGANSQGIGIDNVAVTGTFGSPPANTITTGAVTGSPFNVNCTINAAGIVAFTSTGTFTGNTYTAQLSNSSGSFAFPVNIGTLISNANSGTINITIPAGTISGAGYLIRVVSSNPVTIGSNSAAVTVNLTGTCCPRMTGALINSCNGTCQEGDNEILFFNSGSYSIPVSPANIIVKYESVFPPTVTYTDGFVANAAFVATLNTNAGCGTLFYDAVTVGTIPANSVFMITRSTVCYNYNFSAFCGQGPVYVLFSTDADWVVGGNFANTAAAGSLRYFRADFSGVNPGCITDYIYEPFLLTSHADGDAIAFPPAGGNASQYVNNGCVPPPTVLPIELVSFDAKIIEQNIVELKWQTSSEINNDYFTIERSQNAESFIPILNVQGAGNSNSIREYSALDKNPLTGLSYYRLRQTDYDGAYSYSKIIPVMVRTSGSLEILNISSDDNIINIYINSENSSLLNIDVMNLYGQTMVSTYKEKSEGTQMITISKNDIAKGLYLLRVSDGQKILVKKICL